MGKYFDLRYPRSGAFFDGIRDIAFGRFFSCDPSSSSLSRLVQSASDEFFQLNDHQVLDVAGKLVPQELQILVKAPPPGALLLLIVYWMP